MTPQKTDFEKTAMTLDKNSLVAQMVVWKIMSAAKASKLRKEDLVAAMAKHWALPVQVPPKRKAAKPKPKPKKRKAKIMDDSDEVIL